MKVSRGEDGELVYTTKTDTLTDGILGEAEKEVAAIPRLILVKSTAVESATPYPAWAGRVIEALTALGHSVKEARRRVEKAIDVLRESGRDVIEGEVARLACSFGFGNRRLA